MSDRRTRDFVSMSVQWPDMLVKRCALPENHKRGVEANLLQMRRHLEIVTYKISYFTKLLVDCLARRKV